MNIVTINNKLENKCPEVKIPALYIGKLLNVIEEIILEDRKEIGHYTEDEFERERFRRCIPTRNIKPLGKIDCDPRL